MVRSEKSSIILEGGGVCYGIGQTPHKAAFSMREERSGDRLDTSGAAQCLGPGNTPGPLHVSEGIRTMGEEFPNSSINGGTEIILNLANIKKGDLFPP